MGCRKKVTTPPRTFGATVSVVARKRELEIALRVLVAVTKGQAPDERDVVLLRQFAPELFEIPSDELACEVVKRLHYGNGPDSGPVPAG